MIRKWFVNLIGVLGIVAAIGVSASADNIVETAGRANQFETLLAAAKAADLVDTLNSKGPFTVFAPTDEAFAKLPKGTVESLLKPENKQRLRAILSYHVVPGRVDARQALKADFAPTVLGQRLSLKSKIGQITVNESKVVATDIACDNGIIHVIDNVMLPTEETIPAVAAGAGVFNTLLAAVKTAELADTLSGKGPFTVFAPTDEAFKKLPEGTVENLLKPENRAQLTKILSYHVISGRVYEQQAIEAGSANTLIGQSVEVSLSGEGIKINDAKLTASNIEASNGVIHIIDTVLLPESLDSTGTQKLLQTSVSQGARAFNHGDYKQCADVYRQTCQKIINEGDSLPEEVPIVLEIALKRAKGKDTQKEKAWVLRHGIDLAFFALDH